MKTLLILLCAALLGTASAAEPVALRLWEKEAPGAKGNRPEDIPTLTVYQPETLAAKPRPAIVICPGGGYGGLATGHEGEAYARFFNRHGMAAFVLRYRLGSKGYRHPAMLNDAARALRTVRANAAKWQIDPAKIGVIGSSAGGHLAATLATHFEPGDAKAADPVERMSSRPDFAVLCYPVITMTDFTHGGSRRNLLGDKPSQELIDLMSAEKQVTANTPPTFLWHTRNDNVVPVRNSVEFAAALDRVKVPYELHIFESGPHGIGLGGGKYQNHPWSANLVYWLKQRGVIAD